MKELKKEEHKDAHEFYWKKLGNAMPFDSPNSVIEFMYEFAKQETNKTLQNLADAHMTVEPSEGRADVEYFRGFHNGKIAMMEFMLKNKKK